MHKNQSHADGNFDSSQAVHYFTRGIVVFGALISVVLGYSGYLNLSMISQSNLSTVQGTVLAAKPIWISGRFAGRSLSHIQFTLDTDPRVFRYYSLYPNSRLALERIEVGHHVRFLAGAGREPDIWSFQVDAESLGDRQAFIQARSANGKGLIFMSVVMAAGTMFLYRWLWPA